MCKHKATLSLFFFFSFSFLYPFLLVISPNFSFLCPCISLSVCVYVCVSFAQPNPVMSALLHRCIRIGWFIYIIVHFHPSFSLFSSSSVPPPSFLHLCSLLSLDAGLVALTEPPLPSLPSLHLCSSFAVKSSPGLVSSSSFSFSLLARSFCLFALANGSFFHFSPASLDHHTTPRPSSSSIQGRNKKRQTTTNADTSLSLFLCHARNYND